MINEAPEVHVDPQMDPSYESAEEPDYKKAVDWTMHRNGPDLLFPGRKGTKLNSVENHTQNSLDASGHISSLPTEDVDHRLGAGSNINLNNMAPEPASLGVLSNDTEPEKVWHYKDPNGNVQGPFTLLQLSNWASFFPRDLRIWLTFESEENSLLLTEVLPKQQKDFIQPSTVTTSDKSIWAGSGQDRINSNANNSSSPSLSAECYDPTKYLKPLGGTSPSRSLKDSHALHEVQNQVNDSSTILSSAGSYVPTSSHDERVSRDRVDEWNSSQDNGGIWNPTMNHSRKSNAQQHPDGFTGKDQMLTESKCSSHMVSVLTPQQSERDPATSLSTTSRPECKTMCRQEGSSWSSATNAGVHDLQLTIALTKPETCSPTNPVEDRDSSSASAVSCQSGAPACIPQPDPTSTCNSSKIEATMDLHKTCQPDTSNESFGRLPEPQSGSLFSLKTLNLESEHPSSTPKLEGKETSMNQSGSTSVAHENLATKTRVRPPTSKIDSLQPLKERSCPTERDSITQLEHLFEENVVKRNNEVVNPVSDAEGIAVSDVLESLTEQDCEKYSTHGADCEKYSTHGAAPLQNLVPASAEEEQPQCSSPIALSPWGEPSYYQGEAVDSALWGVQDGNDMWSMPSPTPGLQPSSEEARADHGDGAFVETLPRQGDEKTEHANSSVSGSGVPEQVKPKASTASGPSLDGSTKALGWQLLGSSLEGSAKASGWKPPALSIEGIANASGSQALYPTQGSTKSSGCQRSSSSPDGSRKASGWQQSSTSPVGSGKAHGWQRSGSFTQGGTKAAGWQPSGSSTDRSAKVDGWQRTSSSPEGNRKASGWHSSGRESSKITYGASENRKSFSSHQATTPTGRHSLARRQGSSDKGAAGWEESLGNTWEASKRQQRNSDKNAGCGEALGSNRTWHPSSGNPSRSSQGNHQHDRHSHGSDSRRGSSNYPRRSDHRHDHGSGGSSRPSSRGQPQRGVCKYYENGHCWKGSKCQYLHR
ncbi:Zinc finger CCCH domain-containing protein 20 [Zea mays]|nr:Zinc finger CCCH domain-containing protein 20 [Zea mays]